MRTLIAMLMMTTTGWATCSDEAKAPLVIDDWSAREVNESTTTYDFTFTSRLSQPARMVDGYISFRDALGEHMGAIELPRDDFIPADKTFDRSLDIGSMVVPRVLTVEKSDISATACLDAVVYQDGTKEAFEQPAQRLDIPLPSSLMGPSD